MPFTKPTDTPVFATDGVTLPLAGTVNKINPRAILKTQGYDLGNYPTCEETNWQFNNLGQWVEWLDQETQTLADTNLKEYSTIADMVADEVLEVGDYIKTYGYYSFGDTGGSIYKVVSSGTADGMTIIALTNGLFAEFQYVTNTFSPMQFGAVGDGVTNDSVPMQKLLDLGEDNPSNSILNKGIIVDLNTRNFAVEVTFQSKTIIKNGTLSQTVANVNILQYIGNGTGKSVGWEYLHVEDVTFDGRGLGSGSTNTADGINTSPTDINKVTTNIGLCVDSTTIGANGYNVTLRGCEFKNLYNSNIFFENNNSYLSKNPTLKVDGCTFNKSTSVDTSTINLVIITGPQFGSPVGTTVEFDILNSTLTCDGAILFSIYEASVTFDNCNLTGTTDEPQSFLGGASYTLKNSKLALGTTVNGGVGYLARTGYDITVIDSEIKHAFDILLVRASQTGTITSNLSMRGSTIIGALAVDKVPQGSGTRSRCGISIEGNIFDTALQISPDHTYITNPTTAQQGINSVDTDSIKVLGNSIGDFNAAAGVWGNRFRISSLQSSDVTFLVCTGNSVYYRDTWGGDKGIIYVLDPVVSRTVIASNIFSGGSIVSIVGVDIANVDVEHGIALAGNMAVGPTQLLTSNVDATFLPLNYNR